MNIQRLLIISSLVIIQGCISKPIRTHNSQTSHQPASITKKTFTSDKPVIMFILDSSGSMASINNMSENKGKSLHEEDKRSKIEIAKSSIIDVINQVDKQRYNTSLIAFDNENVCSAYLAVEPNNNNTDNIINQINNIDAQGATPLAKAIELSGEVLNNIEKKLVILFSDGGESCGGNPVKEAKKLYKKYKLKLEIQVIGYAVDSSTETQLKAIAEIGKNEGWGYHTAKDKISLARAINLITKGKLDPIWIDLGKATFQFSSGASDITPKYLEEIKKIADFLKYNQKKIIIIGHTDSVGSNASNLILSLQRAETVKTKLVDFGINQNRMITKGLGEEKPVVSNDTEEGRTKNRRVVFKVIE